jgi:hypothetical protein
MQNRKRNNKTLIEKIIILLIFSLIFGIYYYYRVYPMYEGDWEYMKQWYNTYYKK